MINIFPIDKRYAFMFSVVLASKMLWIFYHHHHFQITYQWWNIYFMLAIDVSVYLSSSMSLVKEGKKYKSRSVFRRVFLSLRLKLFYCRQFSLWSLMNKSFSVKDVVSTWKICHYEVQIVLLSSIFERMFKVVVKAQNSLSHFVLQHHNINIHQLYLPHFLSSSASNFSSFRARLKRFIRK